jgi:aminopeptidase N
MKNAETPKTIQLRDYKEPDYKIEQIDLVFNLDDTETIVQSSMRINRSGQSEDGRVPPLYLNGEELKLLKVSVDGRVLKEGEFEEGEDFLLIINPPEKFHLEIENMVNPSENKALDGLYKSGSIFCTQNEPEGFRRITYYIDRPDNMAKFTTKIIADKKLYPTLLSNGNLVGSGDLDNGLHWVKWEDPFLKPSYLYALVAGDLGLVKDTYKTGSGRLINLEIYCDKGNESKCDHAMESLKKSMKWDEERFGLEYDLDIYMIVAVDSFNMGAMENKGLNIFNSVYVLADQTTATDDNFLGIESVVGHEYFHNWTGNRITCRDWFQLTLKEGLTVYRDQEFSADLNDRTVQRIEDVGRLRSFQFVEDSGPMAHPIKPSSYIEINNFYTATVYEKGAEVIRMVATLLGRDGFRKGMDKYFELYDGQAVRTEDFLHAMSIANGNYDFTQFKNWYQQAGTPELTVHWAYNEKDKTFTLEMEQSCPPTPEREHKDPFFFPLQLGLLDGQGQEMPLHLQGEKQVQLDEGIVHVKGAKETFVFENCSEKPILSLNRNFSAPVKVHAPYHMDELSFLMAKDKDEFNRYDASQTLSIRLISQLLKDLHEGKELVLNESYINAYGELLKDSSLGPAIKSQIMSIPIESILHQGHRPIDIQGIYQVREFVIEKLASAHKNELFGLFEGNQTPGAFELDPQSMGKRAIKNLSLAYLGRLKSSDVIDMAWKQFDQASNMTDEISALAILGHIDCEQKALSSQKFYDKWKAETLVMQKWLAVEVSSRLASTFDRLLELEKDAVYDASVPNLFRSLIASFTRNTIHFHHESGRGYHLVANRILTMDKINPQIASRVAGTFKDLKKLQTKQQALMSKELERILAVDDLSKNVYEIVSKILH